MCVFDYPYISYFVFQGLNSMRPRDTFIHIWHNYGMLMIRAKVLSKPVPTYCLSTFQIIFQACKTISTDLQMLHSDWCSFVADKLSYSLLAHMLWQSRELHLLAPLALLLRLHTSGTCCRQSIHNDAGQLKVKAFICCPVCEFQYFVIMNLYDIDIYLSLINV